MSAARADRDEGAFGAQCLPREPCWDAVVVGAGPAGSMVAYELSRLGRKVLLLERCGLPRWKVCGSTLSPGVQGLLARANLGNLLSDSGACGLHTLRLGGWSMRAELRLNGSVALSRSSLDAALVEAALARGVHFISGARAKLGPLLPDRRIVEVSIGEDPLQVSARVVVAADGLNSGLLIQAGLPSPTAPSGGRAVIGLGGVFSAPAPQLEAGIVHMAVGEGGYVGMVRVEDGSLNVAAALSPAALKAAGSPDSALDALLRAGGWPGFSGPPDLGWRGTPELTRRPRCAGAERLFAVGDASGYVEPFTGEGVLWALSGARALAPLAARAAKRWDPGLLLEWGAVHGRLMARSQRLCRAVAWTLARPTVSRLLLRILKEHPHLADPVVQRVGVPLVA